MSSVLDDINKRRTRQSVGEQPAVAPVEPVAPVAQPMGDQASARAGVAPQPQAVQLQVQEPANRPMGDQAAARVAQGAMQQAESGFNPTAEQKATAMMLVNPALTTPQAEPVAPKQMTYTELLKSVNPGMTPEEKAAQQKRQRNRQIINAVGDGISALANLYYTNKSGVNAYDPSTSLTKAAKERYDKLIAQQREDEERRKAMAYQAGASDLEMAYRRERDAAADKRADKAAADAAEARRLAQENWQKTFDYQIKQDELNRAFEREKQAALEVYRLSSLDAKSQVTALRNLNKAYGKKISFIRPNETNLEIYESVWKASMPQVYKVLAEEAVNNGDIEKPNRAWVTGRDYPSAAEMGEYVKRNWQKSETAKALMAQMAGDTPEKLIAGVLNDDYSKYEVPTDEDYSKYIVE